MKRLTDEMSAGNYGVLNCGANCKYDNKYCYTHNCPEIERAIQKLGEYEDAEEQGLLIRLPCKVGDKVYAFCEEFGILEYGVYGIILFQDKIIFQCSSFSGYCNDDTPECLDEIEPYISDFGKTVFLSREEAERKLKELQKEGYKQWED